MVYAYVMGKRFYRPPKWLTTGEKTGSQFFMPKGAVMWKIFLEIFGYIGTGLVLLSMAMTSMKKLRILNMAGSVISAIYSAICGAWPVVVLNVGLIIINLVKLFTGKADGEEKK